MKTFKTHFMPRLLAGIFLLVGLAFWTSHFVVDAASWTIGGITWNNANFLNQTFWSNNPTSGDIIEALYGTGDEGTAYTQNRSGYNSGSCLSGGFSVMYQTGGGLVSVGGGMNGHNAIVVIDSGAYVFDTEMLATVSCVAFVGSGDVYVSTSGQVANTFFLSGGAYNIIDNIKINGTGGGAAPVHDANNNGIQLSNSSSVTIHNIQSYNDAGAGIFLAGDHFTIQNVDTYNNEIGLYVSDGQNITLNNMHIYNNDGDGGIFIESSCTYCSLNNIQIHNNTVGVGVGAFSHSSLNNIQSYNNGDAGVAIYASTDTNLHNILSYNNHYGVYIDTSTATYYGNLTSFGNQYNIHGSLITGSNGNVLDWGSGLLTTTGSLARDLISNPINTSGTYMLNWGGSFGGIQSRKINYINTATANFSYGANIFTQTQPVMYSGTTLVTGGIFDATEFIGSQTMKLLGTITINSGGSYTNTSGAIISLTATTPVQYRIFGPDLTSEVVGTYVSGIATQNITFSGTDGLKRVFVQFGNGTTRATHYVASITLITTSPVFTGTLASGSIVLSGRYYNTTGVTITYTGINISGATLNGSNYTGGTVITGNGTYIFAVSNVLGTTTGITFMIDTINPLVTGNTPTSGQTISGSNAVTFSWSGSDTNLSGYTLYVSGITYHPGGSSYIVNNMPNGIYTWYVIATDKAGNTGMSTPLSFTLNVPLTGTILFSGTNPIQYSGGIPYTKNPAGLIFRANKTAHYSVTGDVTGFSGTTNTSAIVYTTLSGSDGLKNLYVSFSTGSESGYLTQQMFLDTTAPSIVTLSTPASGTTISDAFTLSWSAASDTGIGLSGYRYFISPSSSFTTISISGFTTATSATINAGIISSGTYYRYVQSLDKLGRSAPSLASSFYYSGTTDITPDSFTFDRVNNARLDRTYTSSTETISGLTPGAHVLATVDRGVLYINDVWTGAQGYVSNGDSVYIELISSDEYDTTVSSILTIGNFSTTFRITTQTDNSNDNTTDDTTVDDNSSSNLSTTEKLQIAMIFTTIKDMYTDSSARTAFMNTLLNEIQVKIDSLNQQIDNGTSSNESADQSRIDALQYLYDIVDSYLGGNVNTTSTSTLTDTSDRHIAPNGRVYMITYDSVKHTYTSPDFMFPKSFATVAAMIAYIDVNNGGAGGGGYVGGGVSWNHATIDTTWQSAPYTAPNKKVYYLFKTVDGRYSSYTFSSAKYFDSLENVRTYIYNNNR